MADVTMNYLAAMRKRRRPGDIEQSYAPEGNALMSYVQPESDFQGTESPLTSSPQEGNALMNYYPGNEGPKPYNFSEESPLQTNALLQYSPQTGERKDPYAAGRQKFLGNMDVNHFVQMAGIAANALDPNGFGGRMGNALAALATHDNAARIAYDERQEQHDFERQKYNYPIEQRSNYLAKLNEIDKLRESGQIGDDQAKAMSWRAGLDYGQIKGGDYLKTIYEEPDISSNKTIGPDGKPVYLTKKGKPTEIKAYESPQQYKEGAIRQYPSGGKQIVEEYRGGKWVPKSSSPKWKDGDGEGDGDKTPKVGTVNQIEKILAMRYLPLAKGNMKPDEASKLTQGIFATDQFGGSVNSARLYEALNPQQRAAYDTIRTSAERYAAKYSPSKAVDMALQDYHKQNSTVNPPAGFVDSGKTSGGKKVYVSKDGKQAWIAK